MKRVLRKVTKEILKCNKCGKYSMEKLCECGGECITTKPAKFSPLDRLSKYRIEYKKNQDLLN